MRQLVLASAALAASLAATSASAAVLTAGERDFVSNAGDIVNGVAAAEAITPNRAWAPNGYLLDGARWIASEANDGSRGPSGGHVDVFEERFQGGPGWTLDWAVLADDTAQVDLVDPNGGIQRLFDFNTGPNRTCAAGSIGCEPGEHGSGSTSLAFAGEYAFQVSVLQSAAHGGSPFGTQYAGVVTTPLPAAGDPIGAAMAGLGYLRRRRSA